MSITRDDVLAAVEKYLPKTANFARSEDLGDYDRDEVFERIIQIILTALLVDKDGIFFVVYLASQRLLRDVDSALSVLDTLDSQDCFKGISPLAPTRIDPAGLTDSQNALLAMSSSLVTDTFGVAEFADFSSSINTFLGEQVVPNVRDGGNNAASSTRIRSALADLASLWASILSRREGLFDIVSQYQSVDLRLRITSAVISAIRQRISEIQNLLPDLTTPEHGNQSEQILVDLAAASSSLKVIAESESPFGLVVAGPLADGFTDADYLTVEGVGAIDPIRPILRGDDGKVFFDLVFVSTLGRTVTSGGPVTNLWTDTGVADFTTVVSAGQYLTLVDRGERCTISTVSPTQLTLSATTLDQPAVSQRYVVTETPPGTYFRSEASQFWVEYNLGSTASTVITSGVSGSWAKDPKGAGPDGTNLKASGLSATLRPQRASGAAGVQVITSSDFTDAAATFLTDGVIYTDLLYVTGANAFGNPYSINSLLSETSLQIVGTWGANATTSWYIEDQNASVHLETGEDLFAGGVVDTDSVEILTGSQAGSYPIDFFVTASKVSLLSSVTYETGLDWEVRYPSGVFYSASGTFLSSVVEVGDVLDVPGYGNYVVASVDSQNQLTLTTPLGSYFPPTSYNIYKSFLITSRFVQADLVDFVTLGVGPFINGSQAVLTVSGVDYDITRLDLTTPSTTLYVSTTASVTLGPLAWSIRAGDTTTTFYDLANTPFTTDMEGAILVYRPGTPQEQRLSIQTVVSSSEVVLSGPLPQGESNIPYAIITTYKGGLQLLIAGRRYDIVRVRDRNTLEVNPPLVLTVGRDIQFFIVNSSTSPLNYRLTDRTGALTFGPAGFPSSLIGQDFDLMGDTQQKGRITAVVDIDGDSVFEAVDVGVSAIIGQRDLSYRIRQFLPNTARTLKTSSPTVTAGLADDVLTIWSLDAPYVVTGTATDLPNYSVFVDGFFEARLASQDFILVRGGSEYHGRYLLLETKNAGVALSPDTSALRASSAEVLLDFGGNTLPIASGLSADLSFDEDGDGYTTTVTDTSATFVTSGVQYGHRIDVTYADSTIRKAYVVEVLSETSISVDPPLKVPDPLSLRPWNIVRSSVSNALEDSLALRAELETLRDVLDRYVVPQNTTILAMLNLLKKQRMDRAIDLLYDGKIQEFADLASTDSSYASRAKVGVQGVGRSTAPAATVSGAGTTGASTNLAGIDPATGKSSPSQVRATATQMIGIGGSEVETRVALAKAVTDLVADERIRSMLQFSLDEARNQGIYELVGQIQSGVISDEDPTLPWIAQTGSAIDKLDARTQAAVAALQYMIDHPEFFDDVK